MKVFFFLVAKYELFIKRTTQHYKKKISKPGLYNRDWEIVNKTSKTGRTWPSSEQPCLPHALPKQNYKKQNQELKF
jgi:hypothetical protein